MHEVQHKFNIVYSLDDKSIDYSIVGYNIEKIESITKDEDY